MNKFTIVIAFAALISCAFAKPGVLAPFAAAPLAYANAPLYAAGGSSQVDVRNNYDGTLSSYATAPFESLAPYSSRYVSGIPAAPVVAKYTAAAPLAAPYASPYLSAPYSPYAEYAASPYAAPFASPFAAPAPYVAAGPVPAPLVV